VKTWEGRTVFKGARGLADSKVFFHAEARTYGHWIDLLQGFIRGAPRARKEIFGQTS